jgi:hypothetical protein
VIYPWIKIKLKVLIFSSLSLGSGGGAWVEHSAYQHIAPRSKMKIVD